MSITNRFTIFVFFGLLIMLSIYLGNKWSESKELDAYFIDQICLDAELQKIRNDSLLDGPIFYKAHQEMKELGYTPVHIQKIIFQGYNKALNNN